MVELFKEIIELQDKLNSKIDPNWKTNRDLEDWVIATNQEFAELMDSFPWAWWKKQSKIDINNIKLELVDIFHFILSFAIQGAYLIEVDKEELAHFINFQASKLLQVHPFNPRAMMKLYREMLFEMELFITHKDKVYLDLYFGTFFEMVETVGMSVSEFSKLYFGKNALNQVRKDFGYDKGEYIKILWNGKEDNEVMMELIEDLEPSFDVIYKALRNYYETYVYTPENPECFYEY